MSGSGLRLQRLLAIRRLSADLDRRALQVALGAVNEVETALRRQDRIRAEATLAGRAALVAGDRSEWLLEDARQEVAGLNRAGLDRMLAERAALVAPATERFAESRLEHEQVKQLVENARQAAQVDADRRSQAATDDWYLSRRMRRMAMPSSDE